MKPLLLLISALTLASAQTPPTILSKLEPTWPALTSNYLLEPAQVRITILPNGEPRSITALGAAIPDNVVRALAQWRFTPHKPPSEAAIALRVPLRRPLNSDLERGQLTGWLPSSDMRKALSRGSHLDPASAETLQANLPRGELPDQSRAALLVYYAQKGAADVSAAIKARRDLLLFLVQTFPQDEILSSSFAVVNTSGEPLADPLAVPSLKEAWSAALQQYPKDLLVAEGAVAFFRTIDPILALRIASEHEDTDIQSNILGDLYARAGLGVNTISPATGQALATSAPNLDAGGVPKSFRDAILESKDLKLVLSAVDTTTLVSRQLNAHHALPAGYDAYCQSLMQHLRTLYPQTSLDCSLNAPVPLTNSRYVPPDSPVLSVVKKVEPVYPRGAKKQHIFGDVRFIAHIDTTGRIQQLELLSAPFALYETAYNAVQQWQYQPPVLNGKPAEVTTEVVVRFAPE